MNWKGELAVWLTLVGAPTAGAFAAWLALRRDTLAGLSRRHFAWALLGLFLLTRVGTHLVVFHVFDYPGGNDLHRVWRPIAEAVLAGADVAPFVDNLYGPLYPYVLASGRWLWGAGYPPGIATPFVVADGVSLVVLLRIARRRLSESNARRLLLCVALCPLLWHGVTVRTQDEPMFTLFLLWTLDEVDRGRLLPAGIAAALGTLLTKAIFPLWVLPVLLAPADGWRPTARRVVAAGGLTVAALGVALLLGWSPVTSAHGTLDVRGSSTWFLVAPDAGPAAFRAGLVVTGLACIAAAAAALRRRDDATPDRAARGVVAVQAAFLLLSPFTLPPHLVHALPFLAWQALRDGGDGAARRAGPTAAVLAAGLCAWQGPAIWLNSEHWSRLPWLIAAFALFWAWTGWLACRRGRSTA